ncbi:16S rRNA (guanine(966)-N(2))-methyltransferase RsmD [Pseudomarimonas arenosa]|uniref:Ribosomal RNA small subunit methyltransferase D n=1 Tax=Pseudomarimonas arenosa TaxID=2774145 RepID=A0AAW3ZIL3_9GAMM|nr:16S rRNA (guanine(966)-N(2))-methyltransferase RsmD [Pseudomarimonas arenosa]MBD8525933.1 16S rRNA (guanine(966)-N(2))-methyltransferase RsmD [Pseudomarimonas arenosa]
MAEPRGRGQSRGRSGASPGSIRIIGGSLRGSRLPVPDRPGLRPSSDRVRETLFNWLQHEIVGARVADLFAGTGCLALEALSRGAVSAVAIERDPGLAEQLRAQATRLGVAERLEVRCADATQVQPDALADIVFVDPPFQAGLWQGALQAAQRWLKPRGWVYLESPPDCPLQTGADWRLHREGRTRDVRFALYQLDSAAAQLAD